MKRLLTAFAAALFSAGVNAVAELTNAGADTARVKKYVRVGGRLYLLGLQCGRKRAPEDGGR